MRFREISWPPTSRKRSKISRHGSWVSGGVFDVDRKKSRIALIERDAGQPNFWDDNAKAQGLLKEKSTLEATVASFEKAQRGLDDAKTLLELADEAKDEASRAEAVGSLGA